MRWARSIGLPERFGRCPRQGPSTSIGAYLSERLISAVLKTGLVFPIPSSGVRRGLPRPPQGREADRPRPDAPGGVPRRPGRPDVAGLEASSQAARRRPERSQVGASIAPSGATGIPIILCITCTSSAHRGGLFAYSGRGKKSVCVAPSRRSHQQLPRDRQSSRHPSSRRTPCGSRFTSSS
jgi:hypothetical protein